MVVIINIADSKSVPDLELWNNLQSDDIYSKKKINQLKFKPPKYSAINPRALHSFFNNWFFGLKQFLLNSFLLFDFFIPHGF